MTPRRLRVLVVHATSRDNATFSYQRAWPRHFAAHPAFDTTLVDIGGRGRLGRLGAEMHLRRWRGDRICLLHSVFSNSQLLCGRLLEVMAHRAEPKVFFIGNEYKFMPQKMAFCEALGVALLVSQSSSEAIHALYRKRLGCAVTWMPNTGLDTELFRPLAGDDQRPVDLGYRSAPSPSYLGNNERERIADAFGRCGPRLGLTVDISLDPADRLDEAGWAAFLNRCKGQLGTEAGGDFFELSDETREAVLGWEPQHPGASFEEIRARFFQGRTEQVPMRIISGRHIEAAGTKTAQILFEGHYNGYFQPDEHYIPLKKDLSNLAEAVEKFRDPAVRTRVADNAYRLATTELTYSRLLESFDTECARLLGGTS